MEDNICNSCDQQYDNDNENKNKNPFDLSAPEPVIRNQKTNRSKLSSDSSSTAKNTQSQQPSKKLLSTLISINKIKSTVDKSLFNSIEIDKAAQSILDATGTIIPIIVSKNDDETFTVIDGDFEYWAAVEANKIEPQYIEHIQCVIIDDNNKDQILYQINLREKYKESLRSLPEIPDIDKISDYGANVREGKYLNFTTVGVKKITSSVNRDEFNESDILATAQSIIKLKGLINPIIVKRINFSNFDVVAGHFEYWAAVEANKIEPLNVESIPVIVIDSKRSTGIINQLTLDRNKINNTPNIQQPVDSSGLNTFESVDNNVPNLVIDTDDNTNSIQSDSSNNETTVNDKQLDLTDVKKSIFNIQNIIGTLIKDYQRIIDFSNSIGEFTSSFFGDRTRGLFNLSTDEELEYSELFNETNLILKKTPEDEIIGFDTPRISPIKKTPDILVPYDKSMIDDDNSVETILGDKFVKIINDVENDSESLTNILNDTLRVIDPEIKKEIAESQSISQEVLSILSNDESEEVRKLVANNPITSSDTLESLSNDESKEVKELVANNPNTSPDTLKRLSEEFPLIVASNINTSENTLNNLSQHDDEKVKEEVRKNPKFISSLTVSTPVVSPDTPIASTSNQNQQEDTPNNVESGTDSGEMAATVVSDTNSTTETSSTSPVTTTSPTTPIASAQNQNQQEYTPNNVESGTDSGEMAATVVSDTYSTPETSPSISSISPSQDTTTDINGSVDHSNSEGKSVENENESSKDDTPESNDQDESIDYFADVDKSNLKDIKKAYHKLARKYHPDHNTNPDSTEIFKNIASQYNQYKKLIDDTEQESPTKFKNIVDNIFEKLTQNNEFYTTIKTIFDLLTNNRKSDEETDEEKKEKNKKKKKNKLTQFIHKTVGGILEFFKNLIKQIILYKVLDWISNPQNIKKLTEMVKFFSNLIIFFIDTIGFITSTLLNMLGLITKAISGIFEFITSIVDFFTFISDILIILPALGLLYNINLIPELFTKIGDFFAKTIPNEISKIFGTDLNSTDKMASLDSSNTDTEKQTTDNSDSPNKTPKPKVNLSTSKKDDKTDSNDNNSPKKEDIKIIAAAKGGVFTKPTNALVGEAGPEAIIPLSNFGKPSLETDNKLLSNTTTKIIPQFTKLLLLPFKVIGAGMISNVQSIASEYPGLLPLFGSEISLIANTFGIPKSIVNVASKDFGKTSLNNLNTSDESVQGLLKDILNALVNKNTSKINTSSNSSTSINFSDSPTPQWLTEHAANTSITPKHDNSYDTTKLSIGSTGTSDSGSGTGIQENGKYFTDAFNRKIVLSPNSASSFVRMMQSDKNITNKGTWIDPRDITSSQRTEETNRDVGGALNSNHLSGNAIDVDYPSSTSKWLVEHGREYGWFPLNHNYGTHIHFDYKKEKDMSLNSYNTKSQFQNSILTSSSPTIINSNQKIPTSGNLLLSNINNSESSSIITVLNPTETNNYSTSNEIFSSDSSIFHKQAKVYNYNPLST